MNGGIIFNHNSTPPTNTMFIPYFLCMHKHTHTHTNTHTHTHIYIYIYIYIRRIFDKLPQFCNRSVVVIVIEYGHGTSNSNPIMGEGFRFVPLGLVR